MQKKVQYILRQASSATGSTTDLLALCWCVHKHVGLYKTLRLNEHVGRLDVCSHVCDSSRNGCGNLDSFNITQQRHKDYKYKLLISNRPACLHVPRKQYADLHLPVIWPTKYLNCRTHFQAYIPSYFLFNPDIFVRPQKLLHFLNYSFT